MKDFSKMPESGVAVVIIDVQAGLFTTDPPPWKADAVLKRINDVTATARAHGIPVFFVLQDGSPEENLEPGTPGWELDGRVHVDPADIQLRKRTCDAFFETPLEQELRNRGIGRLVVAGYATEFCLDSTVRCGASKGFEVLVVEDAHTTNDTPILSAEQVVLFHNWAWPNACSPRNIGTIRASEVDKVLLPAAQPQSKQS